MGRGKRITNSGRKKRRTPEINLQTISFFNTFFYDRKMSMNEESESMQQNEQARIYAESHSCVIFSDIDGWLEQIGSGTIVSLFGKYFVATAAHVISQSNRDQLAIGSILLNHQFFKIINMAFVGGREDEKEDLAWIEVEFPNCIESTKPIDQSNLYQGDILISDTLMISGFPNDEVKKIRKDQINTTNLTHFGYMTGIIENTRWESEYVEDYHILMDYDREMWISPTEKRPAPTAWGLSGGGIWYNDKSHRSLRLAGIQNSWDGPMEKISGIKISEWLAFLVQSYRSKDGNAAQH